MGKKTEISGGSPSLFRVNKLFRTLTVGCICLLLFVSSSYRQASSQTSGGDWTSFTLDDNNSRYQATSAVTSSNIGLLQKAWEYPTQYSISSTPVVQDGVVYFADWAGNVYSVEVDDGSLNWMVNLGGPISSTLLLANGLVYVELGPAETMVYALSQDDGAIVWSTTVASTMPSSWTSPMIYDNLIYFGTASNGIFENDPAQHGEIVALNAMTGALVWSFSTVNGKAGGSAVWGSVAIDPKLNSIYFGTGNPFSRSLSALYSYSIMSLDATTGKLNWYYQVYHSLLRGHDNDFGSTPDLFSVTISGVTYQAVGIGNKNGVYYVLDRTNGKLLGSYPVGTGEGGITGVAGFYYPSGTVNPEIFIPSSDDKKIHNKGVLGVVEALVPSTGTSGTSAWRFTTPGDIDGSVAVVPGAVLFGDVFGNLYGVSISSGSQLWKTAIPFGVQAGVTVAEGHVFVGNFDSDSPGPASGLGLYAYTTP